MVRPESDALFTDLDLRLCWFSESEPSLLYKFDILPLMGVLSCLLASTDVDEL